MTKSRALLLIATSAWCACAPGRSVELASSKRVISTPIKIAELTPASDSATLPAEITFGGSHGRSALYLEFPTDFAAYGTPLQAFITLSPRESASPEATPVLVEAWRVTAAWQAAELRTWSDKPPLAPPYALERFTGSPAHELRIDVTELVRFAAQNPTLNFGFVLLSRGGAGRGASFTTGMSGGNAPRLEVYVR
ncbi:MAG: DNRLRE domain-containing protein [Pseudomonadota bacterium]